MSNNTENTDPQLPDFLVTQKYRGPWSFFRRHFNGDYSLGRSYWLHTVLFSLCPFIAILLLGQLVGNRPARFASAAIILVTALSVVLWFWAVAGTWASAGKHASRGGRPSLAMAAKVAIVLGLFRLIGDIGGQLPSLAEHAKVALGGQLGLPTKFKLQADGRSVVLSGGINDGSAAELEKTLQLAPSVSTVVLSSNGGWIREGLMLADVIRKYGLSTYVEDLCASSCTLAFLAGKERSAAPSAIIGFHSARMVGSQGPTANDNVQFQAAYSAANLTDDFIRKALSVAPDKQWNPSHEELLSAGVLTRSSLGGETAALATRLRSRDQVATEFKKLELYRNLAQKFPSDFDAVVDAGWAAAQLGADDATVLAEIRKKLLPLLLKFLKLASDETLIGYVQLQSREIELLRAKNPAVCAEFAFPTGKGVNFYEFLPREIAEKDFGILEVAIREADPARSVTPNEKSIQNLAGQLAARMTPENFAILTDESVRGRSSSSAVCGAGVDYFSAINGISRPDRAAAIRLIFSLV